MALVAPLDQQGPNALFEELDLLSRQIRLRRETDRRMQHDRGYHCKPQEGLSDARPHD